VLRLQVVTSGFLGGPAYNNFYSNGAGNTASTDLVEAVSNLFEAFKSQLANDTQVACDGSVETFDPTTGQTQAVQSYTGFTKAGTWGTAEIVRGACVVLQWRTNVYLGGREVRGRSFISGLGAIEDNVGNVSSTALAVFESAADTYASEFTQAAVWSPTNGQGVNILTGTVRPSFGLMRTRRD
jgi:hypothetical protein